uniref:Condensin complex subunit 1 C-terminal domain-containing protein n=1 Tax=Megaselia scalaris TaxID=36166 RepID=T1H0N2_MEGSC
MEGNTFCTTLEPKLFSINLDNNYHKLFFQELLALSEAEDAVLFKLDCYKNVSNMDSLRKSALKALAACHYITEPVSREKILSILFKVMEKNNTDIQDAAYECMSKFFAGIKCEKDIINTGIRPLLQTLGDY